MMSHFNHTTTNNNNSSTQSTTMDSAILDNTTVYAKTSVVKAVKKWMDKDMDKLETKEIYVVKKDPMDMDLWRGVLVDSYCQAGKTKKCFEVLNAKLGREKGNTLVLFVTQANSIASAVQTLQRAKASESILEHIPERNIYRSGEAPKDAVPEGNYLLVDFWNSRNMAHMVDFVAENHWMFESIIVVGDEFEQGSVKGVKERLSFIRSVEKIAFGAIVKVVCRRW